MSELYAGVIVDISVEKLDKPFSYIIPEELAEQVTVGTPVMIPFGSSNKLKKGYVISVSDHCDYDHEKLKDIDSIAKRGVSIEDEFMELAVWMKDRYGCTLNKALQTVLPVKTIVKKRTGIDPVSEGRSAYSLHTPTPQQANVIKRFTDDYDDGKRGTYLLYGVTGSGKTDVYMHLMKYVISKGQKVVLMIPEISLTYQTMDRLYAVFGSRVAIIHSKLSPGERYEQFARCIKGEADIIVGPRSAVFTPFSNIGLFVIDEEHDTAYKNENIPRYNCVDVARKRAQMQGASLVLASATPSPESYRRALEGSYTMLKLTERATGAALPDIEVVDMREEMQAGNRSIFSIRLDELIRDRLSKHEQIILFMNRRGYSSFLSCRSCGNAVRCPHCDVSLTVHQGHRLICHYCGYEIPQPNICPSCGSPYIAEFGVGTQKLERMARKMYPEARIARLDTDTATGKKASEKILNDFRLGDTDILIGTQMVVKGHDYHNVTLVGIIAAETTLYVSEYTSAERTFELIAQAAGRAGRGDKPGTVVIQTYKPDHYAIDCAAKDCFEDYYRQEMNFRTLLSYPPAVHIWTVQMSSDNEQELIDQAALLYNIAEKEACDVGAQIIGPVNPAIYKINDYYRKMIYIKHAEYNKLSEIRERTEKAYESKKGDSSVSIMHDFT